MQGIVGILPFVVVIKRVYTSQYSVKLCFFRSFTHSTVSNNVRRSLFSVTANTFEYVFAHLAPKKRYQRFS